MAFFRMMLIYSTRSNLLRTFRGDTTFTLALFDMLIHPVFLLAALR